MLNFITSKFNQSTSTGSFSNWKRKINHFSKIFVQISSGTTQNKFAKIKALPAKTGHDNDKMLAVRPILTKNAFWYGFYPCFV